MGRPRKQEDDDYVPETRRPPATTPQARENQLVNATIDLVEKQIAQGSVSPTVLIHYLKMATQKEQLERQKLQNENLLLQARVNSITSEGDYKKLVDDALNAFRGYKPTDVDDEVINE